MPQSNVKALLFDMGGVVLGINFNRVFDEWAKLSTLNAAQIRQRFQMDEPYQQHEKGQIQSAVYFDHLRNSLKLVGTDEELTIGWNSIFESEYTDVLDAIDLVSQRYPCYGFTNSNLLHQQYWQRAYPRICTTFLKLVVSSEIGIRKPDPAAFNYILQLAAVDADELLFFDDSAENIDGAQQLGIQTVLVTGLSSVIDTLRALD